MEMTNEPQLRSFAQREAPFLKPLMNSLLRRLDRNPKSERDLERLASTHRKVGDLESRIYFLGGFNRVTIPGTLSGDIVRIK